MGFIVLDQNGKRCPGDWPQSEDFADEVRRKYGGRVVQVRGEPIETEIQVGEYGDGSPILTTVLRYPEELAS